MASPIDAQWIIDVDETNFMQDVVERSKDVPVVVDFWAEWCGPCRLLGPLLEEAAEQRQGGFVLAKVNVDEAQALAAQFQIQSIPMVVAFKNGRPAKHFMGVVPRPELEAFLDELCPPTIDAKQPDPALLEAKDPSAAEARYQEQLAENPRHAAANLGLARLAIARGDDAKAREHLDHAEPDPELNDAVDRLKAQIALRELAAPFGGEASARQKVEQAPEDPQALYELGCVLAAAGEHEQGLANLVEAGRRDKVLLKGGVREAMVHVFYAIGSRTPLANQYRDELAELIMV